MNTNDTPGTVRGSDSSAGSGGAAEKCPDCGSEVSCTLGPDYRFNPPLSRPQMWTACCGGGCFDLSKSWTAFTRERAIALWNQGIRAGDRSNE